MEWRAWLRKYYRKYKFHFIVQKLADYPHPWLNYGTPKYFSFLKQEKFVSQREVFADEIVFDIDMDKESDIKIAKKEAVCIAKEISTRLTALQYNHSVWNSGGVGVHIHLFFPELLKHNTIDRKIIKKLFLKDVGQGFIRPREFKGKVQLQTNTTIQLEEAPHRKGGKKTLLWEFKSNNPQPIDKKYIALLVKEKEKNQLMAKYFKKQFANNKPAAIVFIENEQFQTIKDGRDRALFVLTAYYKQFLSDEDLFKKLSEWNVKMGNYFNNKTIKAKIRSARPGLPISILIDLFDELGLDDKYLLDLQVK